jgi:antitoxin CptB
MQDSRTETPDLGKLRWRCRRGMQELDILLARYVERRFAGAPRAEQEAFQSLLETQDPVIYAYCLGQAQPPDHLAALIERITAVS